MKPFPIWCEKCAKQDVCHIGDIVPKCYEPKTEPQTDMAEDIVRSYGFKTESYQQAKAKTEPQTEVKVEPTWVGVTYGRFEDEPHTERSDR